MIMAPASLKSINIANGASADLFAIGFASRARRVRVNVTILDLASDLMINHAYGQRTYAS